MADVRDGSAIAIRLSACGLHRVTTGLSPTAAFGKIGILDWARLDGQPVVVVPGSDHWFKGRLVMLRSLVAEHLLPLVSRR